MKKILFIAFFVVGCSTSIPVNYIPAPVIRGNSDVSIGSVNYIPAIKGKIKENEFQKATGAIGSIYTTISISSIIKNSFQKELLAVGFSVEDFAELNIDINIFTYTSKAHQVAPKIMNSDSEAIKSVISSAFSDFLLSARKNHIL